MQHQFGVMLHRIATLVWHMNKKREHFKISKFNQSVVQHNRQYVVGTCLQNAKQTMRIMQNLNNAEHTSSYNERGREWQFIQFEYFMYDQIFSTVDLQSVNSFSGSGTATRMVTWYYIMDHEYPSKSGSNPLCQSFLKPLGLDNVDWVFSLLSGANSVHVLIPLVHPPIISINSMRYIYFTYIKT